VLLVVALAGLLVPVMSARQASAASADTGSTTFGYESGTYAEGEAIALVVSSVGGEGLSTQADDLLSSATTLMDVSDDAVTSECDTGNLTTQEQAVVQSATADATQRLVLVRDASKTTEQLIDELQADSRVVFAEPNLYVSSDDEDTSQTTSQLTLQETLDQTVTGEADEPTTVDGQGLTTCSDLTAFQWGEKNDGHWGGSGTAGIDIDYAAWDSTTGVGDGPVVAVIDTGVDETNPDLTNKMWRDGMSYPSLVALGGDACGWSDNPSVTSSTTGLQINHGTHCAGVIGAEWNGQGTSGVSQDARIMALVPEGTTASYIQAFAYVRTALDAGVNVRVVSNSWGTGLDGSRSISVAVTQMGQAGAISVFASGNDDSDLSSTSTNATNLAQNPYAVVVDSIGPTGALSGFSNYGVSTTDVLASGATVLSTVLSAEPSFLGEANLADTTVYESFDASSRFDASVQPSAGNLFSFPGETTVTTRSFEGDRSIGLAYDPVTSPGLADATSNEVDLSALSAKPKYLSIRYSAIPDDANTPLEIGLKVSVRCTDGSFKDLAAEGAFNMSGDAWGGQYVDLPADTDWAHFQIEISYLMVDGAKVGGVYQENKVAGTLCVDSIGLGSTRVPYTYDQGTSMACPAVAGVAAVLAEDNPTASAEKLAALVKGSTTYDSRYENLCLSSGRIALDASADPTATPTSATSTGSTATITGYFFGSNPTVSIDGTQASVLSCTDLGDDKSSVEVALPAGFEGGDARIQVVGTNGKTGNLVAYLNQAKDLTYYDNVEMPYPDEMADWTGWQLVGFGGYVYCLPQTATLRTYDHLLRYDPASQSWEQVDIPVSGDGAYMYSAAVVRGRMYVYVEALVDDNYVKSIITLDAAGNWAQTGWTFEGCESIHYASLASDGTSLYLFGGLDSSKAVGSQSYDGIWKVDVRTGAFTQVGTLSTPGQCPRVAYDNRGTFLVTNGWNADNQGAAVNGMERQVVQPDGSLASAKAEAWNLITDTGQLCFAPATVTSGFIFAGPLSNEAAGTPTADTYLMSADGAEPTKYAKRASDKALLIPAACAYDGTLYVLAGTVEAPNRVFSSTAADTYAVDMAEATIDAIADQGYTGKALTPAVSVRFGSQVLTEGVDYTVSYADNVEAGTAKVTVTGMGRFTGGLSGTFVITGGAAPTSPTTPTSSTTPTTPTTPSAETPAATSDASSAETPSAAPVSSATVLPTTGENDHSAAGVAVLGALMALAGAALARRRA
jgi:LPXTG-motif cell wall-anchored protein